MENILALAAQAGWPVDKQLLFLNDRGFSSWESASQDVIDEATLMLEQTIAMFRTDDRKLRIHDPEAS